MHTISFFQLNRLLVVESHGVVALDTFIPQLESDHDAHPVAACHTQRGGKCHQESARFHDFSPGAIYVVVSRQYYQTADLTIKAWLLCHFHAVSSLGSSDQFHWNFWFIGFSLEIAFCFMFL